MFAFTSKTMTVGDSIPITIPNETQINLSRKNIIQLIEDHGSTWKAVALKKGSVLLTLTHIDGEAETILINVDSKAKPLKADRVLTDICKKPGIQCSNSGIISGRATDWLWFYKSLEVCGKLSQCQWQVVLDEESIASVKTYFRLLFHRDVEVSRDGLIFGVRPCMPQSEMKVIPKYLKPYLENRCAQKQVNLIFRAQVYWLKYSEVETLGMNLPGLDLQNLFQKAKPALSSLLANNRQKIVAEPYLNATLGQESRIRIGNDTVVVLDRENKQIIKNGIDITIKPIEIADSRIFCEITVTMKQPTGNQTASDSSEFSSSIWLPFDRSYLVATMQASFEKDESAEVPILSSIPIIAPLFGQKGQQNIDSTIFIELQAGAASSPQPLHTAQF